MTDNHFPSSEQSNFDVQEILNEALDRLPEIQKSVVLLRDYEGYSYDEIAEICKINGGASESLHFQSAKRH